MTTQVLAEANLSEAYSGSYYFIAGAGGDLNEWVEGYEKLLDESGIGKPTKWLRTTGAKVNEFAGPTEDPFQNGLICLLFPLDGLKVGKLAIFKIRMEDRWFDDVINNMRPDGNDEDDE